MEAIVSVFALGEVNKTFFYYRNIYLQVIYTVKPEMIHTPGKC